MNIHAEIGQDRNAIGGIIEIGQNKNSLEGRITELDWDRNNIGRWIIFVEIVNQHKNRIGKELYRLIE